MRIGALRRMTEQTTTRPRHPEPFATRQTGIAKSTAASSLNRRGLLHRPRRQSPPVSTRPISLPFSPPDEVRKTG